jgi:hypothetical protein
VGLHQVIASGVGALIEIYTRLIRQRAEPAPMVDKPSLATGPVI